jgi:hypothetical protein
MAPTFSLKASLSWRPTVPRLVAQRVPHNQDGRIQMVSRTQNSQIQTAFLIQACSCIALTSTYTMKRSSEGFFVIHSGFPANPWQVSHANVASSADAEMEPILRDHNMGAGRNG